MSTSLFGKKVARRHVKGLCDGDIIVDVLGEVDMHAPCPAGDLHRSRQRQAADGDGFNARFVVHHFDKDSAGGGAEAVG